MGSPASWPLLPLRDGRGFASILWDCRSLFALGRRRAKRELQCWGEEPEVLGREASLGLRGFCRGSWVTGTPHRKSALLLSTPPMKFPLDPAVERVERKRIQEINRAGRRPSGAIAGGMTRAVGAVGFVGNASARGVTLAFAETAGVRRGSVGDVWILMLPSTDTVSRSDSAAPEVLGVGSLDTTVSSGYCEGEAGTR